MKQRLYATALLTGVFFLLLSLTWVMPDSNNANVTIPANQEFILGEFENSNYRAKLQNKSNLKVDVTILEKESNNLTQKYTLEGKGLTSLSIRKNEKVILKNVHNENITVKVKSNRNVEGMRYQSLSEVE